MRTLSMLNQPPVCTCYPKRFNRDDINVTVTSTSAIAEGGCL